MTVEKLYSGKVPEGKEDGKQRRTDKRNKCSVMWDDAFSFTIPQNSMIRCTKVVLIPGIRAFCLLTSSLPKVQCRGRSDDHESHSSADIYLLNFPKLLLKASLAQKTSWQMNNNILYLTSPNIPSVMRWESH